MMKVKFSSVFAILLAVMMLAACAPAPSAPEAAATPAQAAPAAPDAQPAQPEQPAEPASNVTLNIATNMTGNSNVLFEQICADFTAETGIKIDYEAPADGYEPLLKARMAANDLPDVFATHGWSVARYGDFLRPLNDQPWFSQVSGLIKPSITDDKNGNVYVLPVDLDVAGIIYNRDMLIECGVDVDGLKTWADFEAACQKIKAKGYTPVYLGGTDSWTIGQFFDWVAPSFYITNEASNDRAALVDGSFDWNKWSRIADMFAKWNKLGYFNEDSTTSDYATTAAQMGQGKVAFTFFGNYFVGEVEKAGSVNVGMMPVPAETAADEPTLISGEHLAVGVWKESKHEAEALQFISYLARPDVMKKFCDEVKLPAGFNGIEIDLGAVTADVAKYANLRTFPYFDRVYLPSGMWDDLCDTGIGILNGSMNTQQVNDHMKESYLQKME